ncbi:MAG TPA: pyruvate ferredoxin oxidoreductase [Syntrophales bacterium]|nr:pyruvate ferredoxin oxidoreductase [Syntrophobacterales bacterium]HQL91191.1 pyruvate ferredoxin oxidoreductase [Syntrophales bacterium]
MKRVLEGSQAVAEAVRLARVQVVSAYPITPQTHIVEFLSEYCASGTMNARFLRVESEHSCMAALIGAQSTGVRTFTATSGQGLALMHELLHWASGARLPIVMAEVNRAFAPGWNIWVDQTDSLAQRDTGWIQFYCEDSQEVLDTTLQAYRLAESVNLPVMVVLDAFFLSHTYEPVDVPEPEEADRFLPPYEARFQLDTQAPCSFGPLVPPAVYMEMRHDIAQAMDTALLKFREIEDEYAGIFGRRYGAVEAVRCEDAEIVLVTSGTVTSTARSVLEDLRGRGEKTGLLKIKLFRPFPVDDVRRALGGAKKIAVIDRNFSFGASGIFAQEVRSALCNVPSHAPVFGYVAGIGGRDVTPAVLEDIYRKTKDSAVPERESVWIGLQEV